jgi:hypothetical protein
MKDMPGIKDIGKHRKATKSAHSVLAPTSMTIFARISNLKSLNSLFFSLQPTRKMHASKFSLRKRPKPSLKKTSTRSNPVR